MSIRAGARLGPYEILSAIGAGGMGEVYRARDTKLNRDVALKILPEAFALDPERLVRFKREAQVLASLNHPNIAAIYGFEDSGSTHALVLELVDGPTLSDRIAKGPIPLDEALPIAKQIAEALEAAHEQGIIHRDLKPANIKVRDDGTVKVLDFGLAKALEPASAISPMLTNSPTITSPAMMTGVGTLLGTAAYMSPEQSKGRPADKRSDVWAFGCVLYEMLTGRRAFAGEDIPDTLANVLKTEPEWSALPRKLTDQIQLLLHRCLAKDRRSRISDVAILRFLLSETWPALHTNTPPTTMSVWRSTSLAVTVAVVTASVATFMTWGATRRSQPPSPAMRFSITPPPSQRVRPNLGQNNRGIAVSPDDKFIVYTSDGGLVVRPLGQLEGFTMSGTNGGQNPFVSPDGEWIGYESADGLRKVPVSGGPSVSIIRYAGPREGTPTWGSDGTIIFGTGAGLMRVPDGGGEPQVLVSLKDFPAGSRLTAPSFLPDARGVLFTIEPNVRARDAGQIAVFDFATRRSKVLVKGASTGVYVSSGHLLYLAAGALRARRFDLKRLEPTGNAAIVLEGIRSSVLNEYAVSQRGTLVYLPANDSAGRGSRTLMWVDRAGREEPIPVPAHDYGSLRLSPDERRIAVDVRDEDSNSIWLWDIRGQTFTRLTVDQSSNDNPIWTPDSRRIIFRSDRGGAPNLFWQAADGTGTAQRITTTLDLQIPKSISPDGKIVLLSENVQGSATQIARVRLDDGSHAETLAPNTFASNNVDVSPDGRWITYQSNESGRNEIYVRPFPNVNAGRWQVSAAGGSVPQWARSGRELFYQDANGRLTSVSVSMATSFSFERPKTLFNVRYVGAQGARAYDVSRDGQRFLVMKETTGEAANPSEIVVVLNWFEELKQRVRSK